MSEKILDKIIDEGNILYSTVHFVEPGYNVIRTFSVYKSNEPERYQRWLSSVQRFVKSFYQSELEEIKEVSKKINPKNHRIIMGILEAIKFLPNEPENKIDSTGTNINITNNQSVSQSIVLNVFLEAISDEISGKDLKEIKNLLKEFENKPEEIKPKLIEKVKSFGNNVLSNIVANILTNPAIYTGIH